MEMKFCQSCGMPLTQEILGTNADGSKNEDYCMYCYKDGKFTQDCSMEEMIEFCSQFVDEVNKNMPKPMTKDEYLSICNVQVSKRLSWRKPQVQEESPPVGSAKATLSRVASIGLLEPRRRFLCIRFGWKRVHCRITTLSFSKILSIPWWTKKVPCPCFATCMGWK